MHLVAHTITQIVIVSISEMAGICTNHVVARLSRDDIEQIDIGSPVANKPLGGVGIDGCSRGRTNHIGATFPRGKQQHHQDTYQRKKGTSEPHHIVV